MAHETEVKAKLTLEDKSSGPLEHIKHGFEEVQHHATETMHELLGFGRDVAASFLGFQLGGMIESVREFGHEILGAAGAEEEQIKSLTGVLAMSDDVGESFEETRTAAAGMKDELEAMSITAGVSSNEVISGFEQMAERGDHTREELKGLTEEMIYAGRAVPGGFSAITQGMQAMELGMVRATNPVVTMIKQTGLMDGNAKQIARTLTKMAADGHLAKVMELGEKAVGKMAERMKSTEPTLEMVETSLKGMREQVFEHAGKPIVEALVPALGKLGTYLEDNQAKIERYAEIVGEGFGEAVTEGAKLFEEGFEFIETHSDEIKSALHEAGDVIRTSFGYAKDVALFIYDHREALAIAFGAKTALGVAGSALGAAKGGVGAVVGGVSAVKGALTGETAELIGNIGKATVAANLGQASGASTAIGNAAASLGTVGAAAVTLGAGLAALGGVAAAGYEAFGLYNDLQERGAEDTRAMAQAAKEVTIGYGEQEAATQEANDWLLQLADAGKDAQVALLETAMSASSAAAELAAVGKMKVKGQPGYDIAAEAMMLGPMITPVMKDISKLKDKAVNLNMNGGQTFNMKQDFRDQDPDRMAVIFRRDISRQATNRLSANTGMPFGT
jgi:hypothetical protein